MDKIQVSVGDISPAIEAHGLHHVVFCKPNSFTEEMLRPFLKGEFIRKPEYRSEAWYFALERDASFFYHLLSFEEPSDAE